MLHVSEAGSGGRMVGGTTEDPGGETNPQAGAPGARPVRDEIILQEHQRVLLERLRIDDAETANIYLGALQVLDGPANADRFALAAHGIRLLMDALDLHGSLAVPNANTATLTQMVNGLQEGWRKVSRANRVDGQLPRRFIKKLERFFTWYDEHRPKRNERAARLLNRLDPAGGQLPDPIAEQRVRDWHRTHDFFTHVCHHRRQCTETEFSDRLDGLERFLLDFLRPQTFARADDLDALIREGEGDG